MWKDVDGVRTYFLWLVGEYDESGVEIKGYGYAPDSFWSTSPLFLRQSGSYFWYLVDQLGTPQKLVDNEGNEVWSAYYEAFGEAHVESELVENNLRFPGQYFDAETGFHQNYLRDYDPETGRYLELDPIGLNGGPNGYIYVGGNPVNLFDPTGEIAPLGAAALYYAQCIASCAAMNAVANQIGGAACGLLYEENCWLGCLNPFGKLRRARKLMPRCGGRNSFTAGTLVETESGLKPIEEVKIGEKVLAFDERSGTTSYQPVTDLIKGEKQYKLVEITLDSGKNIEATAEHPFYIKGKGWNPAGSLKVGQALVLHDGTTVVVAEVDTSVRREVVFNFSVANAHTYFVGGHGVLVHNAGKRHSDEERALIDMLNKDTMRGKKPLNPQDANAAMDLGKGLGLGTADHRYGQAAQHWVGGSHIHIDKCRVGKDKHIPALP